MTKTLEEIKQITIQHMKKELDIMEIMFQLDNDHAQEFHKWYINHPYCKGIREIQDLVKRGNKN